MQENVVMIGLGYIGLPTAALIASKNIHVLGVDVNQKIVDTVNNGEIHIVEPKLDQLVKNVVEKGYLKAANLPVNAKIYLIAVPTPFKGDYEPDIAYVDSAIKKLIPTLSKGALVIIESTCPVGTTEKMQKIIFSERPELKGEIFMAFCPERVLPGNVIFELEHNDRAIGGINKESTQKAVDFYSQFVSGKLHKTNARTAELTKLVENSSRDVQIAFANELSMICDKAEINVWELINLANRHPRVNILQPGTGVGGHCIAVDPWFIVSDFPKEAKIIRAAREINNYKTQWVIEKIKNRALHFKIENDREPFITCMGLAFKPNIDDLRESPALLVTNSLNKEGFNIIAVEPNIDSHNELELYATKEGIDKADIVVFLVNHKEFKNLNTNQKIVLDFVNAMK